MWLAEDWCIHQSWIILFGGNPHCNFISFCLSCWRKGMDSFSSFFPSLKFFYQGLWLLLFIMFAELKATYFHYIFFSAKNVHQGLWLGIICALIVQVFSLATITIRTNWEQEVRQPSSVCQLLLHFPFPFPFLFIVPLIVKCYLNLYSYLVHFSKFARLIQAKKATERVYDEVIPVDTVS